MQYILSLLPALACPVGMGLMVWFMMRTNKNQAPGEADQAPMTTYGEPREVAEPPKRASLLSMLFMCFNWRVVAALAVVGLIIGVVASQLLLGAIPLLILAACPLSMLFMMRGMQGGRQSSSQSPQVRPSRIEGNTREGQIAALKGQLASTQAQLEALSQETAEPEIPKASVISEAESVARAARRRGESRSTPKW